MALQYSDLVMAFGVLVTFVALAPTVFDIVDKLQGVVDPLTAVILGVFPSLLVIAIILSVGVSARS